MIWLQFLATALVIVFAGVRLARYGDVLGEKTGLGRSWAGVVLLAATTSLPELFTGFGATALAALPNIAVGDVLGSCMFNLLILSFMDAVQPEPLSTRAHQGHTLSIGFGLLLLGVAGLGLSAGPHIPALGWIGLSTPVLIVLYFVAMRVVFTHEQHRRAREVQEVAEGLQYAEIPLRTAALHYTGAAVLVVGAALWLPRLGAALARQTGLGEDLVGSFFIAITTSLPEIVVSLAAVRIGAIDLGIGNVLGSNLFNLLILGLDDVFYRQGPLLVAADASHGVTILVDASPVDAIVREAARRRADVIVMGWRGHGAVRRLLTGSVSRGVVRRAPCAVLVVRRALRNVRHMVVGFDGSAHAERAVELISSLNPPRSGRVSLFTAVDTMHVPSQALVPPDTRAAVSAEVARINKERLAGAHQALDRAARMLTRAGWKVDRVITTGAPLRDLLATVAKKRTDLVVVGAKGVTGMRHLLLGSVAEGALNRSPSRSSLCDDLRQMRPQSNDIRARSWPCN